MALSQLQCLDDNHINLRTNQFKPEFFYSEEQRLALETLLEGGREEYEGFMKTNSVRTFLSDLEVARLTGLVEVYSPASPGACARVNGDTEESQCSLQYWPDRSDTTLPELDMGWPDCAAYRGVTRAQVYAQPPLEGDTHVKEVVRKAIAQAQKVIAVVMDLFTDADIFKDLLDASFKRKVSVYIILEATGVPHFLQMCECVAMHTGHLKNLRVRSIRGTEFFTRSSKKVCGSQSQKFMFVDGDKAVSGSYSFTWTASRLDRNIITVLTGQAVDAFDKLFRDLYVMSNGVNLNKINLDNEPRPEPAPQTASAPLPSATMALKLINPKYALVSSSATAKSNPTPSERCMAKTDKVKQMKDVPEAPQIHPGLFHLEKANMVEYLPIWPEPDPPSDVIGFINIRDYSKPLQAHLMRSELFEVSKAIRFKDPFQLPEEPLPEKASPKPRVELLDPLPDSTNDKPLMQSHTGLEVRNMHTKPLDQMQLLPRSQKEDAVFLSLSSNDGNDSPLVHSMIKPMESLPIQREDIQSNSQCSAKNITNSSSYVQYKDQQILVNPQLQTVMSSYTPESNTQTVHTSIGHFETTSGKQSFDRATNTIKTTPLQTHERLRDKESDTNKIKGKDIETPNHDSNFSSLSEEYFECSDSLTIDPGFEGMVKDMPISSGLSEHDQYPKPLNTCVTQFQASKTPQVQQLALMAYSGENVSGSKSLKETEEPQLQSGLRECCNERRVTEVTIHSEPEVTEAALVIEADRLSELVLQDDQQGIEEMDASSPTALANKPFTNPLEGNADAQVGSSGNTEKLPIHELGQELIPNSAVNNVFDLKPVENTKISKLSKNEVSNTVLQSKLAMPIIVVQTKTESQSIVFSDRVKEVPVHSGFNYTSLFTSATEVKDVKHSRHLEKISTHAGLQSGPHAKIVQDKNCQQSAQLPEENFELEQTVENKSVCCSVPVLKENEAKRTMEIKDKAEPSRQKTLTGLKVGKPNADAYSSVRKQSSSHEVLGKDEQAQEHTFTKQEQRNQPEAKPRVVEDVRKPRRLSPKPSRTSQEAKGGSTKASVTKLHSSNLPTRPAALTLGAQNYPQGKQPGQSRASNTLPKLPDKFSIRRTAPSRSSQSQFGHSSRTDPSPARLGSSQKKPQAQLDRTTPIQLGQSNTRQRSPSTSEDSLPTSGTIYTRRSRSLKEKLLRRPVKQSEVEVDLEH